MEARSLRPTGATAAPTSDCALVELVRAGDDSAFEELYRRYRPRIAAFVRGQLRDEARAEDVTQEAFFSALRRMRATDSKIAFKPWIYEIARNATIDSFRRASRAQELSIDADDQMRASDRTRLVGSRAPEAAVLVKERFEHLRGAFDELPDTHHRVLVMRELEGLSYREIGERLELSRPAVESVLFRARRRLVREYEELDTGRRCHTIQKVIARLSEQAGTAADERRLARHARRCSACRRQAREFGVDPQVTRPSVVARAAALLPLPAFLRRRGGAPGQAASGPHNASPFVDVLGPGTSQLGFALSERAAALVTAAALAGAGGAMLAAGPVTTHRGDVSAPSAVKEDRQAPARAPRREPSGMRFTRPKSTRGAVPREAAPRFRSAAPRSLPAAPRSRPSAKPPAKPAPPAEIAPLPEGIGLDEPGAGDAGPGLDIPVQPEPPLVDGVSSGRTDAQPPAADEDPLAPIAAAATSTQPG